MRKSRPQALSNRTLGIAGVIRFYMAGTKCPSVERMIELLRDCSDIEPWERGGVYGLFEQMSPEECEEFLITSDSSPRELARLLRTSGVDRGIVVNWINQFSSDPNWRDDEALTIEYGDMRLRQAAGDQLDTPFPQLVLDDGKTVNKDAFMH